MLKTNMSTSNTEPNADETVLRKDESQKQKAPSTGDGKKPTKGKGKASTVKTAPIVAAPIAGTSGSSSLPAQPQNFNKEALLILRELNKNVNATNDKVESLSVRVDNLYAGYDAEGGFEEEVHVDISEGNVDEGCEIDQEPDLPSDSVFGKFSKTFRKSDEISGPVDSNLAELVNETFREGLADENYHEIIKNIHRPSNCETLKEIKVHSAVWGILKQNTQAEDSKLRGIQGCITKAACNLVMLLDKHAADFDSSSLALGMNAVGLLGQSSKWISTRRKECHKRDMDPRLHHLCSAATTNTDVLYGDTSTIVKDIKDIQEMNKISRNIASKFPYGNRRPMRGGARFFRGARRVPYQSPRGAYRGAPFRPVLAPFRPTQNGQRAETMTNRK